LKRPENQTLEQRRRLRELEQHNLLLQEWFDDLDCRRLSGGAVGNSQCVPKQMNSHC
jgi:hypothetical protein